jgi:hypothetical protein
MNRPGATAPPPPDPEIGPEDDVELRRAGTLQHLTRGWSGALLGATLALLGIVAAGILFR